MASTPEWGGVGGGGGGLGGGGKGGIRKHLQVSYNNG